MVSHPPPAEGVRLGPWRDNHRLPLSAHGFLRTEIRKGKITLFVMIVLSDGLNPFVLSSSAKVEKQITAGITGLWLWLNDDWWIFTLWSNFLKKKPEEAKLWVYNWNLIPPDNPLKCSCSKLSEDFLPFSLTHRQLGLLELVRVHFFKEELQKPLRGKWRRNPIEFLSLLE